MKEKRKNAVSGQQKTNKLLHQNSKMQELLSKSAVLVRNLKERIYAENKGLNLRSICGE